jgi:hypothetical protein
VALLPLFYWEKKVRLLLKLYIVKDGAINLMRLIVNCNSDSLYSRPWCHVVSKAFSISVDILLFKFRET